MFTDDQIQVIRNLNTANEHESTLTVVFSDKKWSNTNELVIFICRNQNQFCTLPFPTAQGLPPLAKIFVTRKRRIRDALFHQRVPCLGGKLRKIPVRNEIHKYFLSLINHLFIV